MSRVICIHEIWEAWCISVNVLRCMCLKKLHYFKTAGSINFKIVLNSEQSVTLKSRINKFSD
jgi:hypothetical protein